MKRTLKTEGILPDNLILVDGDLVKNYNRAFEKVTGKKTALESFHIDKRGESPEIEVELGNNYLQCGASHRFMIIVTPDQRNVDLIHEEFSFDENIIDVIFDNYMPAISVATRVDGLFGELEDDVRAYHSVEDLLLLNNVTISLKTPSGFLKKAMELQDAVKQLQRSPELLIANNSRHVKKTLSLAREVGDVRGMNLSQIEMTKEIKSFYSRLFQGTYVFRLDNSEGVLPIQRPKSVAGGAPAKREKQHFKRSAVVIYKGNGDAIEDGPSVSFIPIQSEDRVIDFLGEAGLISYSPGLIGRKLSRIEDGVLLQKEIDVSRLSREDRIQAVEKEIDHMPDEWHGLRDVERKLAAGNDLAAEVKKRPPSVKKRLIRPFRKEGKTHTIVHNLITKLCPDDYEGMYDHNRRDLEYTFDKSDETTRDYIVHVLRKHK